MGVSEVGWVGGGGVGGGGGGGAAPTGRMPQHCPALPHLQLNIYINKTSTHLLCPVSIYTMKSMQHSLNSVVQA